MNVPELYVTIPSLEFEISSSSSDGDVSMASLKSLHGDHVIRRYSKVSATGDISSPKPPHNNTQSPKIGHHDMPSMKSGDDTMLSLNSGTSKIPFVKSGDDCSRSVKSCDQVVSSFKSVDHKISSAKSGDDSCNDLLRRYSGDSS